MKRLVIGLLAIALIFSLCACGVGEAVADSVSHGKKNQDVSSSVVQTPEPT